VREILFRGKRIDNGEWVEGDLFSGAFYHRDNNENCCYILDYDKMEYDSFESIFEQLDDYEVIPKTVGQYTGEEDKNGKKIFEGSIVSDEYGTCAPVVFEDESFFADYEGIEPQALGNWCVVVGNIFDNPELLEVR
jgi:uncharacterized phage protein (TIGR01671 family)